MASLTTWMLEARERGQCDHGRVQQLRKWRRHLRGQEDGRKSSSGGRDSKNSYVAIMPVGDRRGGVRCATLELMSETPGRVGTRM